MFSPSAWSSDASGEGVLQVRCTTSEKDLPLVLIQLPHRALEAGLNWRRGLSFLWMHLWWLWENHKASASLFDELPQITTLRCDGGHFVWRKCWPETIVPPSLLWKVNSEVRKTAKYLENELFSGTVLFSPRKMVRIYCLLSRRVTWENRWGIVNDNILEFLVLLARDHNFRTITLK